MRADEPRERRINTIAGWATLGLLCGVVLLVVIIFAVRGALPEPRSYVLYVTNSGTLQNGDPVYMSGRRIGRVTDTEVVSHDGRVQTRVEIELFERFRDLELPRDSRAAIGGPGLVSGPRLFIYYGASPEVIAQDGEITETEPAPLQDEFTGIGEQLKTAGEQIDSLVAVLSDEALMETIKQRLVDFRISMDEMARGVEEMRPAIADAVAMLESRPEQLEDMLAEIRYGIGDVSGSLVELIAALNDGSARLDELNARTSETVARLDDYSRMSADMAERSEDPGMQKLFLQTRWQSAELAAMLRLSAGNPGAAGDAPGRRRAAAAFNGGRTALAPFGGETNVDEME